jgi:hypothetical protein
MIISFLSFKNKALYFFRLVLCIFLCFMFFSSFKDTFAQLRVE